MAGAYAVAAKNAMLDALGGLALYASAHTADPGSTGASELTTTRGSVTWSVAALGVLTASTVSIDVPAGSFTYVGFWSAVVAGTYYGKIQLPATVTLSAPGQVPLASLSWDLNATASA